MFLAQGSEAGKASRMLITRQAKIAPPPGPRPTTVWLVLY